MAGITLAQAEEQLAASIAALASARSGENTIRDRSFKPVSLAELQAEVDFWDKKVKELDAQGSRTGRRVRGVMPV